MTIPDRARKYIAKINAISGQEGHKSTFQVARILRMGFCLTMEEALPIMLEWNTTNAQPPWTPPEISHKLNSIDITLGTRGYLLEEKERLGLPENEFAPAPARPLRWPKCDPEQVIELLKTDLVRLMELNQLSPIDPSDPPNPEEILDSLFCQGEIKDPYLCLGKNLFEALSRKRSEWKGHFPGAWQYIVPNFMRGPHGETALGKPSPRAKSNVMERRFIVIECDFNTENHSELFRYITEAKLEIQDVCTTVLAHLSTKHKAPLAMAVNSGSKSIHGWFPVGGASRRVQTRFFRDACLLGADPQMANTNQWTRFPNGIRTSNGMPQKVEYFNPDPFLLNF